MNKKTPIHLDGVFRFDYLNGRSKIFSDTFGSSGA
jgi:hypothetical protein